MEDKQFDFGAFKKKEAMKKLKAGKGLSGLDGLFAPLIKLFLEEVLESE